MSNYNEAEIARQRAEDERLLRERTLARIEQLTGRVPASVLAGGAQRAAQWKEHAVKARKTAALKVVTVDKLRAALATLEQYE